MKFNVGRADKIIRIVLGIVIIAFGFYYESYWGAIGLIPLITGIIGTCPIYSLFKVSTAPGSKTKTKQSI